MALARGYDSQAVSVMTDGDAVEAVGPSELPRGLESMLVDLGLQAQAVRDDEHQAQGLAVRLAPDREFRHFDGQLSGPNSTIPPPSQMSVESFSPVRNR